ncbi:MAG: multicopper oxidase domain-containing protein [Gemmatimonadaceae bacterium]
MLFLAATAALQLQIAPVHLTDAAAARPNDNRVVAGVLKDGTYSLALDVTKAIWHPEGRGRVAIPIFAFAERGQAPSAPGPLVRVPAGTEMRISIRNTLPTMVRVRGLQDHSSAVDTIDVAAGATRKIAFRVDVPGTYFYWGRTTRNLAGADVSSANTQLHGAFIVDPVGTKPASDRVMVIGMWEDTLAALGDKPDKAFALLRRFGVKRNEWVTLTVNGLAWPYTERLSATVGDTVVWRVINISPLLHPMHLHGFYYDVLSRGNAERDTIFAPGQQRKVVTESMTAFTTLRLRWLPTRPGNWLFHCHVVDHINAALRLDSTAGRSPAHGRHAEDGMAGLVTAITVNPAPGVTLAGDPMARRKLRVHVTTRERVYRDQPGYSFVLQQGAVEPVADSVLAPSSTLVLRQHEPTEITVVNRTAEHVAVHWHGIELESYYDGVGDFSGYRKHLAPPIAPGDSFVARMTPDRAGTFIYHTHTDEMKQLSSGLYAPLIVLPHDAAQLDTTNRILLLGSGGPQDDAPPFVNGSAAVEPIELRAGVGHRLRLINIDVIDARRVRLLNDSLVVQQWRAVAKDGADLPARQAALRPAVQLFGPGETFDFEVRRDAPQRLLLEVSVPGDPAKVMRIPVIVQP